MEPTSKTARAAVLFAALAVAFWAAKTLSIGLSGGSDERLASALFLAGLACTMVASACVGLALAQGSRRAVRIMAAVLGPVVGMLGSFAVIALLSTVQPADPSWIWGELNLWIVATATLLVALLAARRRV